LLENNILKNLEVPIELKEQKIIENIDECNVTGDYRWTLEAISNIIKNCIEHTPTGGTISVKTEENSIFSEICIYDNGHGISKDDLPHIFERFYKGQNSASESFGIGLALAKSIIEENNGYVSVDSEEGKRKYICNKIF